MTSFNPVNGQPYNNTYHPSNPGASQPQGHNYEYAQGQQPYGQQPYGQVQPPGPMQGLMVPGAQGKSFDLSQIARLSQASFKFFVECSQYTRGDFLPMLRHCVATTLNWANRLDRDGVEAYMIDGSKQEAVTVQRGQEQNFADMVAGNQSSRRPAVAGVLRTVAQEMLGKLSSGQQVTPHVLLFAVSGQHFDSDDIVAALTHLKDNLTSMGYAEPWKMFMVGFIKIGDRGGMFDSSKNGMRKLDNHKVIGRMVECDTHVKGDMEERIFEMLKRFSHPEVNGDNHLIGRAQDAFSKFVG